MRYFNRKTFIALIATGFFAISAQAAEIVSHDDLLQTIKSGRVHDAEANEARLAEFRANRAAQQKALSDERAEQARQERLSVQLEKEFEQNDIDMIALEVELQERLGDLKELFGVLQQASGDARGQFDASITQVQFPTRSDFMTELAQKMGQTSRLASMEEIERLWFEIQREMTESGKVVRFNTVSSIQKVKKNSAQLPAWVHSMLFLTANTWNTFLKPDDWLSCHASHRAATSTKLKNWKAPQAVCPRLDWTRHVASCLVCSSRSQACKNA